jgi:hypothetical protein
MQLQALQGRHAAEQAEFADQNKLAELGMGQAGTRTGFGLQQQGLDLKEKEINASLQAASMKAKTDQAKMLQDQLKEQRTAEFSVGNEFRKVVEPAIKAKENLDIVTQAVKTGNPAGDMALIYSYVKMLDPGGRVTDSEVNMAGAQGALPAPIQSLYNVIAGGGALNQAQRSEILDVVENIYGDRIKDYTKYRDFFSKHLQSYGLNPSTSLVDPGIVPLKGYSLNDAVDIQQQGGINYALIPIGGETAGNQQYRWVPVDKFAPKEGQLGKRGTIDLDALVTENMNKRKANQQTQQSISNVGDQIKTKARDALTSNQGTLGQMWNKMFGKSPEERAAELVDLHNKGDKAATQELIKMGVIKPPDTGMGSLLGGK